ncbi:MAG: hypothetical protein P8047_17040, partial [Gammaproteobacteria bacterium]
MRMKNNKTVILTVLALFSLVLGACNKQEPAKTEAPAATTEPSSSPAPTAADTSLPDVIRFTKPALYPEGLEYDAANNRFLVTSLHEGTVGTVT